MENTRELKDLISPYLLGLGFDQIEFDEENLILRFETTIHNGLVKNISFGGVPSAYIKSNNVKEHLIRLITNDDILTIRNHLISEELTQAEVSVFRDLPFKTKADKEAYLARLQQHIEEYVLPFFELYPDLQTFHDTVLDKIPFEDKLKYIPGQNNIKALIIFKLFDNPKYAELRDYILEQNAKAMEEDPEWKHFYEKNRKDYLKAIEYLESDEFKAVQNK